MDRLLACPASWYPFCVQSEPFPSNFLCWNSRIANKIYKKWAGSKWNCLLNWCHKNYWSNGLFQQQSIVILIRCSPPLLASLLTFRQVKILTSKGWICGKCNGFLFWTIKSAFGILTRLIILTTVMDWKGLLTARSVMEWKGCHLENGRLALGVVFCRANPLGQLYIMP